MNELLLPSAYLMTSLLYEGKRSVVYRGIRQSDRLPVILKRHRKALPNPADLIAYKLAFEMATEARLAGIAQPLALCKIGQALCLIQEDVGGDALALLGGTKGFQTEDIS